MKMNTIVGETREFRRGGTGEGNSSCELYCWNCRAMTRGEKVCSQICSHSSFGREENEVSHISMRYGLRGKMKCRRSVVSRLSVEEG